MKIYYCITIVTWVRILLQGKKSWYSKFFPQEYSNSNNEQNIFKYEQDIKETAYLVISYLLSAVRTYCLKNYLFKKKTGFLLLL